MNTPLRHPIAILKERPFDGCLRRLEVDWSARPSIADILDAQDDVPDYFREHCVARVIDEIVPREMWPRVRPKPCCIRNGQVLDVVVIFTLPLGHPGGGGSGKNAIGTVASVAVLLAATAISGGAFGIAAAAGGAFGVSASVAGGILGAGVGIGGSFELSSLIRCDHDGDQYHQAE